MLQILDADMLRILSIPGHEHFLSLLEGYGEAVLTPNAYELDLLLQALRRHQQQQKSGAAGAAASATTAERPAHCMTHALLPESVKAEGLAGSIAEAVLLLRGPGVFAKGRVDLLGVYEGQLGGGESSTQHGQVFAAVGSLDVRFLGAPKRSGGQGDVLCGVLAQMLVWGERRRGQQLLKEVEVAAEAVGLKVPFCSSPTTPQLFLMHAASLLTRQAAALAFRHHGRGLSVNQILDRLSAAAAILFPNAWLQQETA